MVRFDQKLATLMTTGCAFAELKGHRVMFLSFDAIYLRHCTRFQSMTKYSVEHIEPLVFRTTDV